MSQPVKCTSQAEITLGVTEAISIKREVYNEVIEHKVQIGRPSRGPGF